MAVTKSQAILVLEPFAACSTSFVSLAWLGRVAQEQVHAPGRGPPGRVLDLVALVVGSGWQNGAM